LMWPKKLSIQAEQPVDVECLDHQRDDPLGHALCQPLGKRRAQDHVRILWGLSAQRRHPLRVRTDRERGPCGDGDRSRLSSVTGETVRSVLRLIPGG
jgi:hypothetical protein